MASSIYCSVPLIPPDELDAAAANAVTVNPENRPRPQDQPPNGTPKTEASKLLAASTTRFWGRGGVTLSVSFLDGGSQALRDRIVASMNGWSRFAKVRFVLTASGGHVRITRSGNLYWSKLGTDILLAVHNEPTMALGGFTDATSDATLREVVEHETGHTLGFDHEHLRPEIVARIDRAKALVYFANTQGWDNPKIERNVLTPLVRTDYVFTMKPDEQSVMCYNLPASIMVDSVAVQGGF